MKTFEEINDDLEDNNGENCTQDELLSYLAAMINIPKEKLEARFSQLEMEKTSCNCCELPQSKA